MPTFKYDREKKEVVQVSDGDRWTGIPLLGSSSLTTAQLSAMFVSTFKARVPALPPMSGLWGPNPFLDVLPPKEPPTPRRTQSSVIGWRGWDMQEDDRGPVLCSVSVDFKWEGPVTTADHAPKGIATDRFGLHAYKKKRAAASAGYDFDVLGEVLLFGRVVVHQKGFRAEKAMIRRLLVMPVPGYRADTEALAARYGCEVVEERFSNRRTGGF